MKKQPLLTLVIALGLTANLSSQDLPNGGFETWYSASYFEEPEPYASSNSLSYMMGDTANVIKTTDSYSGTYAARLETLLFGSDTVPGLIMIGMLSGENIIGGVPFNDRPDSLTGYVKYNLEGGDELFILCLFTRQGLPIGTIEATYSGTQGNYTRISIPVEWLIPFLNPDTLKVVISNTSEITTGHPGSMVYLDHFQFIGTTLAFPNGEFENWTMLSEQEPESWTTLNYFTATTDAPYATKSNDEHSGDWAIRIETASSFVGQNIGYLTNGDFHGFNWTGGLGVDQNPSVISGYYKFDPQGTDTAQVGVFTLFYDVTGDSNILVEDEVLKLPPASTYTYFEVPLEYNGNPPVDTVNISFSAGLLGGTMNAGNILLLDDIAITYYPVGITSYEDLINGFSIYPNPCRDYLYFLKLGGNSNPYTVEILDITGNVLIVKEISQFSTIDARIDVNTFQNGFYLYRIYSGSVQSTGKFTVNN